ncbi:hypothetical protein [Ruegeria arenilitoris]|uniref:hypothetical protein n=1 Tax=Ruegeria arenilitoris TaxID=1173585 RepID=UPI001C971649|nr:hypothetical protein [Ruegeria arenilitoris]MBY6082722.1 hypothetical protein [Ruegeria arenilitoris]
MTMSDQGTELDLLFAEARQAHVDLPDDLAVRILTDAEAIRLAATKTAKPKSQGFLGNLVAGLGGWQALSGLAAASVVGAWVGFAAPSFLPDPANYIMTQDASYMVANLGLEAAFLEEAE